MTIVNLNKALKLKLKLAWITRFSFKRRKRLSLDYFDGWSEEEKKKADERLNWKAASTDDEDDEAGF